MTMPLAERGELENEMIFRRANENIIGGIDKLDKMHRADGNPHLVRTTDYQLEFLCECSDESCTQRIKIRLSKYRKIHTDRNCYIVKRRHELNTIETIVNRATRYNVVMKNKSTKERQNRLNSTELKTRPGSTTSSLNFLRNNFHKYDRVSERLSAPFLQSYDFVVMRVL